VLPVFSVSLLVQRPTNGRSLLHASGKLIQSPADIAVVPRVDQSRLTVRECRAGFGGRLMTRPEWNALGREYCAVASRRRVTGIGTSRSRQPDTRFDRELLVMCAGRIPEPSIWSGPGGRDGG
jgi:hypothetical protein